MFDGTANQEQDNEGYECEECNGTGGFDASRDCEEYDDWQECPTCLGVGRVYEAFDDFKPKRDAWMPGD